MNPRGNKATPKLPLDRRESSRQNLLRYKTTKTEEKVKNYQDVASRSESFLPKILEPLCQKGTTEQTLRPSREEWSHRSAAKWSDIWSNKPAIRDYTPEEIRREKKSILRGKYDRNCSDDFGASSGKRRTKMIEKVTLKNGAESSSFSRKSKVFGTHILTQDRINGQIPAMPEGSCKYMGGESASPTNPYKGRSDKHKRNM